MTESRLGDGDTLGGKNRDTTCAPVVATGHQHDNRVDGTSAARARRRKWMTLGRELDKEMMTARTTRWPRTHCSQTGSKKSAQSTNNRPLCPRDHKSCQRSSGSSPKLPRHLESNSRKPSTPCEEGQQKYGNGDGQAQTWQKNKIRAARWTLDDLERPRQVRLRRGKMWLLQRSSKPDTVSRPPIRSHLQWSKRWIPTMRTCECRRPKRVSPTPSRVGQGHGGCQSHSAW